MEACVPTPTTLADSSAPAWTLSVVRPGAHRHCMINDLRGVPKPALQTVFGRMLGRRIWSQRGGEGSKGTANVEVPVPNAEISAGMVQYLGRQAAEALRQHGRLAKAIGLTITFAGGESMLSRTRFPLPTDDVGEITEAATKLLLNQLPTRATSVASVKLTVTSVETVPIRERENHLGHSMLEAVRA
jgi:impB/mucB/samB family protein